MSARPARIERGLIASNQRRGRRQTTANQSRSVVGNAYVHKLQQELLGVLDAGPLWLSDILVLGSSGDSDVVLRLRPAFKAVNYELV